jgi:hypothetical protein
MSDSTTVAVPRDVFDSAIEDLVTIADEMGGRSPDTVELYTKADLLRVAGRLKGETEYPKPSEANAA